MSRRVKVVVFDPQNGVQPLREMEIDSGLDSLQAVVDGLIEGIYPGDFIPELAGVHGYVNGEFVYTHPEWRERPWKIGPYEYLCGPAVFMCSDNAGNEADISVSKIQLAQHIKLTPEMILCWSGDIENPDHKDLLAERVALAAQPV